MKLKEPAARRFHRPSKAAETLGQQEVVELEPDWAEIRKKLIQTKEVNEKELARESRIENFTYRPVRNQENTHYLWYTHTVFALRVLFPNEPELGALSEFGIPEIVPRQLPPKERFKAAWHKNVGEDEWEYIILLNSIDWKKFFADEESYKPPSPAEFLFELKALREQKNWIRMAKVVLAGMRVHPEIAQQLQIAFSAVWPEILASEWGMHWYDLNEQTLGLGVLINPQLRASVDTLSPGYIEQKRGYVRRNYGEGLAWFKIIEAEDAGFTDTYDLFVGPPRKKLLRPAPELPERLVD